MAFTTVKLTGGVSALTVSTVQQLLYNTESLQPEGTRMQLVLQIAYPSYLTFTNPGQHFAGLINIGLSAKGVTPWSENSGKYAFVKSSNEIAIEWVKGGIFVEVVLSMVLGALVWYWIKNWTLNKVTATASGSSGGTGATGASGGLLGTANLWAYVLLGVGALATIRQYIKLRDDQLG